MSTDGQTQIRQPVRAKGFLTLRRARDLAIIAALGVAAWKLADGDLSLAGSDLSDLLSILLALFAVAMSVAFYLKATETSNQFYDNVYRFTKDVSEILGRIEAGFGERLRHLDEGYSGLRERFSALPFDLAAVQKKAQEEKEEIGKREQEMRDTIASLMERAQIAEAERSQILNRFGTAQEELARSQRELARMQKMIHAAARKPRTVPTSFLRDLRNALEATMPGWPLDPSMARIEFNSLLVNDLLPGPVRRYMESHGWVSPDGDLTAEGLEVLQLAFAGADQLHALDRPTGNG